MKRLTAVLRDHLRQESQLEVLPPLERMSEMTWLLLLGWYLVVMMRESRSPD
jgi:uncharacterized membrane protein YccF (DUF307 family)